jgi:CO/xanthine dehydrogenase Mo-binding subunit
MAKGMAMAAMIDEEIAGAGDDALVLTRDYFSQSIDASAMEADNGNVWYDPAAQVLHAVLATQSPYEVATNAAAMVTQSRFGLKAVDLKAGYTVGYGTKDKIIFPYFCVIAGLYGEGRPVRLANDRFEQFQMGMKRHAFWIKDTLVVDRTTGRFRVMKAEFRADGGGRPNLSLIVGMVGTTAAQSIYYLPKSDLSVAVLASRAVEAGSTRGFGTLQTMAATEMLVDEAAAALGIDAIDLRLANVFRTGMKNTQGAVPLVPLRNDEILRKAKAHALWAGRETRKAQYDAAHPGKRYGVGFAHVQKNYGSGAEAAVATLELARDGRLTMRHGAHEMGPGVTTSQAVIVARILGKAPDAVQYGVVEWPEMPLTSTERPTSTQQATEDELQRDPRWTPAFQAPMATSNSAYYLGHATREAARVLMRHGIWPAARALWAERGRIVPASIGAEDLRAADGKITAGVLEELPLSALAAKAHELGAVTAASVHAFNRREWAQAEFDLPGAGRVRLPLDALAVKYGDGAPPALRALMKTGGFHFIERATVRYPPVQRLNAGVTHYAPMATLVELVVDTATGEVELLSHHSLLDCGPPIVPSLVSGQIQGGIAMGIGHALHEFLPLYEDGPGDGTWNWNRYRLPRASDVATWTQTAEILPPLSDSDPPRGIAEVTMIAVVPAIANAVHHAVGKRFYEFPITPEKIRAAL